MNDSEKKDDCCEKVFEIALKGVCLRKEHDMLFNEIRKLLPVDVVKKVDNFKPSNMGILLTRGDYNLLNMTVSYIWYRHKLRHFMRGGEIVNESDSGARRQGLIVVDFHGYGLDSVITHLFSEKEWLMNRRLGVVLFLRNIHIRHRIALERIGQTVRTFKRSQGSEKYKDLLGVSSVIDPSILIVNTAEPDALPVNFKQNLKQFFEIIDLEARKKKTTNKLRGTKKHYSSPEKREELIKKYLKEFPDESRHVIASKVNKELEKEGGRPLEVSTMKKEISIYRRK